MKYIAFILMGYCLYSCSSSKHIPIQVNIERDILAAVDSVTRNDTIPTVVVNNINIIMPPEKEHKKVSDENMRLFISGVFTSIAILLAGQSTP